MTNPIRIIRWLADYKAARLPPPQDHFQAPRRKIHTVFIHCSASDNPNHDRVDVIRRWHKARGWRDIGYHYVVSKQHGIQPGRSLEATPAAQKGHNRGALAICVTGRQEFTPEQFANLRQICAEIDREIGPVRFRGHCEVSSKLCPVFDYRGVLGLDGEGYRQ